MYSKLASNLWSCLCLLSAGIIAVYQYVQPAKGFSFLVILGLKSGPHAC
jgi:hypothetical protein